jgi:hypothetical protein
MKEVKPRIELMVDEDRNKIEGMVERVAQWVLPCQSDEVKLRLSPLWKCG